MTNTELLQEGINLMFIGIGFVMLFLLILVYAISGISKLINRFFPEPNSISPSQPKDPPVQHNDFSDLHPVIIAAIAHHRRQQGIK